MRRLPSMMLDECAGAARLHVRGFVVLHGGCRFVLLLIFAAQACLAATVPPTERTPKTCDGMEVLKGMSGSIEIVGGPKDGGGKRMCRWFIDPNVALSSVTFHTQIAKFEGNDLLQLSDSDRSLVAMFSRGRPMLAQMVLVGTDTALWTLVSESPQTHILLSYTCAERMGLSLFGNKLTMPQFAIVVGIVVLIGFFACILAPLMAFVYWKGRHEEERLMRESRVVLHSAHMRHRSRDEAEEQWITGQLEALPQETYEQHNRELQECCLCLDHFKVEDIIRVLPCQHYFHKECIDIWFLTRRFRVRRCPLCNANPVAARRSPGLGVVAPGAISSLEPRAISPLPGGVVSSSEPEAAGGETHSIAVRRGPADAHVVDGELDTEELDTAGQRPTSASPPTSVTTTTYGRGVLSDRSTGFREAEPEAELSSGPRLAWTESGEGRGS